MTHLADFLTGIVGVVEATSAEKFYLWKDYHNDTKRVTWKQGLSGPLVKIGELDNRPIMLSLFVDEVNGHRILFIECTSQVVDWVLIDAWLVQNIPQSAISESGHINKQNAMNFWNVLPRDSERKSLGMQSSLSSHSASCNRQTNGTFCDCGFS